MLNDSMHCCREGEGLLNQKWENQQKNLGEMLYCLATLENREEERELRIALQEDQILQLQDKLIILQGKVCRCHKCPGATEGPMLGEPSEPTDEEEEGLEYVSNQSYLTPTLVFKDVIAQDTL